MARKLSDEDVAQRFAKANLEPLEPYINSHVARRCKCLVCGSEILARLTWFTRGNGACNVCAYRQRSISLKKYTAAEAEALLEKLGYEPLEPFPGNKDDPWHARCIKCGHEGTPRVKTLEKGHRCQSCAAIDSGVKGREDRAPEAVKDFIAAGIEPMEPYPGTSRAWHGRCMQCGSEVRTYLSGIRSGQGGCLPCAIKLRADNRRFSHEKAAAIMLERGLEVLEPYTGAMVPWQSRCVTCGTIGSPSFASVADGRQGGCWACGKKKISASKMIDEDVAAAVMLANQLEPLEPYPGSAEPWLCRCMKCQREVTPRRHGVQKGQGGCKYCQSVGLDRTAPGVLYLVRSEDFQSLKIGVTSTAAKVNRLERHAKCGWVEVQQWSLDNGAIAEAVETLVLNMWRKNLGVPFAVLPSDMPQGGFSETVALIYVSVDDALAHIATALSAVG